MATAALTAAVATAAAEAIPELPRRLEKLDDDCFLDVAVCSCCCVVSWSLSVDAWREKEEAHEEGRPTAALEKPSTTTGCCHVVSATAVVDRKKRCFLMVVRLLVGSTLTCVVLCCERLHQRTNPMPVDAMTKTWRFPTRVTDSVCARRHASGLG